MRDKVLVRRAFRQFIQYLNIGLFVCGQVVAVVAAGFSLLIITKQLFLVKNQAAWGMAMWIALGVAVCNVLLSIPVFLCAVKMECYIPKIKKIGSYLIAEYITMLILMLLTTLFFFIHTGGEGFTTWQGDYWWVIATKTSWVISWCAHLTTIFQIPWCAGTNVDEEKKEDGSSAG